MLKIEYKCLDTDVITAVEDDFLQTFAASSLTTFSRILSRNLTAHLRSTIPSPELDTVGLIREVSIGTYDEYGWDKLIDAISPKYSQAITHFLQQWHQVGFTQ